MLSKMLTEMFNDTEQRMLEYMAAHYASSYYEYHRECGDSGDLMHPVSSITADRLSKVFHISEDAARNFLTNLEQKHVGHIRIHQKHRSTEPCTVGEVAIRFDTIGDSTDNRQSKDTEWFFDFNTETLHNEILKPTADAWLHSLDPHRDNNGK